MVMDARETGELELIQRIVKKAGSPDGLLTAIGDDACVIDITDINKAVVTTDMLIENTHFDLKLISPEQLGYKSAAVNISDVAAMGASPKYALLSMGIPSTAKTGFIEDLTNGFINCLNEFGTGLAGGDTTAAEQWVISVTIIGFARNNYLRRSTAQPGDNIFVSGTLGDSAAGLSILRKKLITPSKTIAHQLISAHIKPDPRVDLGLLLSDIATSAIDLSDGLGTDLRHICRASGTGAIIYKEAIPISDSLRSLSETGNIDSIELAVSGGEDYELLFTMPPSAEPPSGLDIKITKIGKITDRLEIVLMTEKGQKQPLGQGYEHFKDQK